MQKSLLKTARLSRSAVKPMEKLIIIGKIGAPHGVRGEVRIIPLTDFPDRFDDLKNVYLDEGTVLSIKSVKYNKQFIILKFSGIDNREALAPLNGKLIKVKRSDVPPLAEGEYYSFDIIGLDVFDESGENLGRIKEILKTGSNDVYVVGKQGEAKEILVPALKKVVTKIDLSENKMIVILPEEME
jgi:16S rRNA processing protein RimM